MNGIIEKSLFCIYNILNKAALPPGTKRQRKDGIYEKQSSGKWTKIKKKKEDKPEVSGSNKKLTSGAIKHFGLTNDINEAGYLMENGDMLDFSGKKFGGDSGERVMDHREVSAMPGFKPREKGQSGTDYMIQFMDEANAVRIDAAGGLVNSNGIPSKSQISAIVRNIKNFSDGDFIILDMDNKKGDTIDSIEIDNPRAMDILNFYNKKR